MNNNLTLTEFLEILSLCRDDFKKGSLLQKTMQEFLDGNFVSLGSGIYSVLKIFNTELEEYISWYLFDSPNMLDIKKGDKESCYIHYNNKKYTFNSDESFYKILKDLNIINEK